MQLGLTNHSKRTVFSANQMAKLKPIMTCPADLTYVTFPSLGTSCAWQLVTYFPALGTGYVLSRAWQPVTYFPALGNRLRPFPRLAPVTSFPARGTGYVLSRAWQPVTCFPALGNRLRTFSRLAPVTYFPALGTSYVLSRAWYQLRTLLRLATGCRVVTCLSLRVCVFCD